MNKSLIISSVLLLFLCCGFSDEKKGEIDKISENRNIYIGYKSDGDKPTIGIKLIYENGVVSSGAYMIFSSEFPKVKEGQICNFITLIFNENKLSVSFYLLNNEKPVLTTYQFEIKEKNESAIILLDGNQEIKCRLVR